MKRKIVLFLVFALVISMFGCAASSDSGNTHSLSSATKPATNPSTKPTTQQNTKPGTLTNEDIVKKAFALGVGDSLNGTYQLTGIVSQVEKYSSEYGDVCLYFTVSGKSIYCYWLKGDVENIRVGDTLTVEGTIKNYNGTIEFDKPALVKRLATGKDPSESIAYLGDRSIQFDDIDEMFTLLFSFKDENETRISAPATLQIRIVNDNNETVYNAEHHVSEYDFGTWTSALHGDRLLGSVEIPLASINTGSSDSGKIYFTVKSGNTSFKESVLEINGDLPVKGVSIALPQLPLLLEDYTYSGKVDQQVRITNIRYEIRDEDVYFYFTGEKLYDDEGQKHSETCEIGWKLYDSEGYVVASGTAYTVGLAMGEKFKDERDTAYDCIRPGETYRLELLDTK